MTLRRCCWLIFLPLLLLGVGCGRRAVSKASSAQPLPREGAGPSRAESAGIVWSHQDLASGLEEAKKADKPVMMDVFATWCGPCKLLDQNVFSRPEVGEVSKAFVTVKVDGDENKDVKRTYRVTGYPTVLFLAPDGREIGRSVGSVSYDVMLEAMAKAQQKLEAGK
jgi:thiol:disulfide interchange protein